MNMQYFNNLEWQMLSQRELHAVHFPIHPLFTACTPHLPPNLATFEEAIPQMKHHKKYWSKITFYI
jgi:hypothetical protein